MMEQQVSRLSLLCLVAMTLVAPRALAAQDVLELKSATHLRAEYLADLTTVHDKILSLAKDIPADKYGWRPTPGTRSVAEVLMHVAGEWYLIGPMSVGARPPADFGVPKDAMAKLEKVTAKADILAELDKSWAHTRATIESADPAALLGKYEPAKMSLARAVLRVAGDQHEHLGQLITYARSVGVTPVWSK
jgi:uncharacterized damage-inducible protein DinB